MKSRRFRTVYFFLSTIFFVGSNFTGCSDDPVAPDGNPDDLVYVAPEAVGYSSEKLQEATQLAEQNGYAAVMAVYDGMVFYSYGETSRNYWCHSIRKPFLSALYGIHVYAGDINLEATMQDLGIDDIPPSLTQEEKQATVRDLLKSRSGIYHEAAAETQTMIDIRPARGSHPPDTFFYYNNWDFNALGTIFEQETGKGIFDEFKRRIADPVGMQDFSIDNCLYSYELDKSMHPAYKFRMSARDMARFGILYQKRGIWNGERIIPADWIDESTTAYSIVDSASGTAYGYMWNVFPEGSAIAQLVGHSGYYHTGIGVHALIIIPDLNLVIVERYDTDGTWRDPDVGLEIGLRIINAAVSP